ncbi:uncharacterized protein LOC119385262 [Rhipicephalus sanguineus]|uniref:Uncharacterized protein n=1 Tax=Rhipicephalus sanguineus TaxID=34632 RepID=A0A9D4Q2Q4_RHISA|nr:uncharacterized protein LOC119385262 [Rhipicephalus sanguineus]KAH7962947.1 hypothetical protein HPB52_018892 [Rhipicephalus sanguineus]
MHSDADAEQKSRSKREKKASRWRKRTSRAASESSSRSSTSKSKPDGKSTPAAPLLAPTNPEVQTSQVVTPSLSSIGIPYSPVGTLTPKDNPVPSESPSLADYRSVATPTVPLTPGEGGLSTDASTRDGSPSHAATDPVAASAQPFIHAVPAGEVRGPELEV